MEGAGRKWVLQPADTVEEFGTAPFGNGNADPVFEYNHSLFIVFIDEGEVDQVRFMYLEKSIRF